VSGVADRTPAALNITSRVTSLSGVERRGPPHLAPIGLALTVLLFTTGIAYLIALARALREDLGQT
jgi:hypothetical protein